MSTETRSAYDDSKKIVIVTGIAIGEETKGNATQFFTEKTHAHTVWRSGGFQATHNITLEDGHEHSFRHFSAGTFEGASTYLKHMVINPAELFAEAQLLEKQGITDPLIRILIDKDCITATEFHRAMSWLREILRGENKKGTIGTGAGEAVKDSQVSEELVIRAGEYHDTATVVRKLTTIRNTKLAEAKKLIASSPLGNLPEAQEQLAFLEDERLITLAAESMKSLALLTRIVDESSLETLLTREGTIVTETSHGALLHPRDGFVPHVTQIDPTSQDILKTLCEKEYKGKTIRIGVSRCYLTRHGAGPLVSYSSDMSKNIHETHNNAGNDWLGEFRNGYYDILALRYGIEISGGKSSFDGLMISYMDELVKHPEWKVCEAYTYEGEIPHNLSDYFEMNNGLITAIKRDTNPDEQAHYQHQLRLTALLSNCRPVTTTLRPTEEKTLEQVFIEYAGEKLGVPVIATAHGPKASDRKILPGYRYMFIQRPSIVEPEFNRRESTGVTRAEQLFEKVETTIVGLEGPIHRVMVSLQRGENVRQVGEMYVKAILAPDASKQTDGRSISEKWEWLRAHNIPVVSTLRTNDEGDAVLMSDATANGKYQLIDKHTSDKTRESIKITNLDEVKKQIIDISQTAFDQGNGVFLSWESYAVQVDEHGVGTVIVLDLGALSYRLKKGKALGEGSLYSQREALRRAQQFIDTCLE
jgi:adenylosuccinate synthase